MRNGGGQVAIIVDLIKTSINLKTLKMKLTILTTLIIVAFGYNAFSQLPIDEETGKVVFTDVVQLPGMSKEEIMEKAKTWIVTTLKSGDNMVELSGNNSDQIVGTGNIKIPDEEIHYGVSESLNFKFIVKCKDGRYKYSVENFSLSFLYGYPIRPRTTSLEDIEPLFELKKSGEKRKDDIEREIEIRKSVKKNIDILLKNFIAFMKKTEDDW